jgi:hypothetical protein
MGAYQEFMNTYPWFILVLITWSLALKGAALWYAAKRDQHGWFIALIVFYTLGILEIVYFFSMRKRKTSKAGRIRLYWPRTMRG